MAFSSMFLQKNQLPGLGGLKHVGLKHTLPFGLPFGLLIALLAEGQSAAADSDVLVLSTILVTAPRTERAFATLPATTISTTLPGTTPMLDDVPLGSTHYWYNNGLDMHRAVSPENIRSLSLIPGSGSPELASINALGAGILARTDAPSSERRMLARLTGGSHNTWRGFFRADSGVVQGTPLNGGRGYLSLASLTADKWKGMGSPGQQPFAIFNRDDGNAVTGADGRWGNYHDQWNAKWVQPLGTHELTLWANVSDKRENDYADLLLQDYRQRGRALDNWTNWQDALSGDKTVLYGSGASWRNDTLLAATLKLHLADNTWLSVTPYQHDNKGNGDWHLPFISDSVVTDMKFRRSKLDLERKGVNLRVAHTLGNHDINAGIWWEKSRFDRKRCNYDLFDWRAAPDANLNSIDRVLMDRSYDMEIVQAYMQDRYVLPDPRWSVLLGAKSMRVASDFVDMLGVYPSNRLITRATLLPQAGLAFRPRVGDEWFLNFAANISAKPITVFTQAVYDDRFKAERSDTVEMGWRRVGPDFKLGVSLYDIHYQNRLLQIANCSLLGTCPSLLANVGSAASRGVEGQWKWDLPAGWIWSGALAFNDARYRDDYVSNGLIVRTKGQRVINAPDWLFSSELRRNWGDWHIATDVQHTGQRSASYTGDLQVSSFTLWGLGAGYETKGGPAGAVRSGVRLQIRNLFDAEYIATLGSSGFYANDADGRKTYIQVGAPRGIYMTVHAEY
jgi:iron complex outermembrane receptor protein